MFIASAPGHKMLMINKNGTKTFDHFILKNNSFFMSNYHTK